MATIPEDEGEDQIQLIVETYERIHALTEQHPIPSDELLLWVDICARSASQLHACMLGFEKALNDAIEIGRN